LQEQLEKRASFQRLVALLGADEQVTNEFETILSARRPASPQVPDVMSLVDSSDDLVLSVSREFTDLDTLASTSNEFKRSKITVRNYEEPKAESNDEISHENVVHERGEEVKNTRDNSTDSDQKSISDEVNNGEPISDVLNSNQMSLPNLDIRPSEDTQNVLQSSSSNISTGPSYFNFDDYVSRDELKLIEEAIMTLRQDSKINFVKVRKALVKHNLRNEVFEKSVKELKQVMDEERNNSKNNSATIEKEFSELWQSVDDHLKEFKVDLFSESSQKIEQKSIENFAANSERIDFLNEQIKELKSQING